MPPGWTGGVKIVPQEQCLPSIDSNRHSVQFATIFNYFIQEIRLAVFYYCSCGTILTPPVHPGGITDFARFFL
jgi:hypothetical protein